MTSNYNIKRISFTANIFLFFFKNISLSTLMHFFHFNEFKNSVVLEIGFLHSGLFLSSHFHFLTTVQLATSKQLLHLPKQMTCLSFRTAMQADTKSSNGRDIDNCLTIRDVVRCILVIFFLFCVPCKIISFFKKSFS